MEGQVYAFSLRNGNYRAVENCWFTYIVVDGAKVAIKEPSGSDFKAKITLGDFGKADPEVLKLVEEYENENYNIEMSVNWGQDFKEMGVLSRDGKTIITKGVMGVGKMKWATEEEIAAIENEGDPIDAPPGPYKIQPEYQGKLLWITGPPGLGKSTSAQLLGRNHGYVYYEADCFGACRNPYIPLDVDNPSMAQISQKPLKGEGYAERKEICKKYNEFFTQLIEGKGTNKEHLEAFFNAQCDDILRERKRIGGDWAIAAVTLTREVRDLVRARLGPKLVFVILSMDMDDVRKRVKERHHGEEAAAEMMAPINKICDPIGADEENVVGITVSSEMTREDVIKKILESVE